MAEKIPFKYTSLGIRAKNNFVAALAMVNKEIAKKLNEKDRGKCTTEEFKFAISSFNDVLQTLVRRVKKAQGD